MYRKLCRCVSAHIMYKTVLLFCKFQNGGRVCGSFAAHVCVCVVCQAAALH